MRLAHKMEQNGNDFEKTWNLSYSLQVVTRCRHYKTKKRIGVIYQLSNSFMFESVSRKEERMVCLSRRSDHFSKQMVSSPVWWCISGEHQHWGYSPFYRLPRHDHLSGGKMEKLNLSVSLRLTTQRGIFLQNHFLRPTLPPIYSLLFRLNWGMRTVWQHQTSFFHLAKSL